MQTNMEVPDESTLVQLGTLVYENVARYILEDVFGLNGAFSDHRQSVNIGDPDRIFYRGKAGNPEGESWVRRADVPRPKSLIAIEWKTPWALKAPDDLAGAYNRERHNEKNKVVKAIHQLYGYMTFNNLTFGILPTIIQLSSSDALATQNYKFPRLSNTEMKD
ncbi:hypothetical protein H072_3921 [Dactylellina haptotyla CBS 200.50]|uniref:Uncharacterized protein n=1 Tax=Dactylellina haptotyla (strain CBS 200.50) TaxID=1284197 RepID=S8AM67_DACHA|nr:hypothetical protein H072_3921 [Dactylellina haptotyla CBS 200.50]